jgi:four helix bundle protein
LLRAARSTTANIAEGYGRFHYLENAKFCSNSRGSCWEVLDHLIAAADEDLISSDLLNRGRELVGHAVKLLNGYMNYLKRAHKAAPVADPITDNR